MAKGLDELIDWLVAETAYCGEAGFRVDDFVASVSRFSASGRTQPKAEDVDADGEINGINNAGSNDGVNGTPAAGDAVDMPLARNAWKWLVARPEILVGHKGDRGHLTLDEALALPEAGLPEPVDVDADANTNAGDDDAEDQKIDLAAAESKRTGSSRPKPKPKPKNKKTQKTLSLSAQALAAAANDNPSTRPRLYATEKTIWYTLTGHDVDYKKIPMLEWKCLQGIASARTRGILQADLRELVDQDKRSVPKRTDFLAAKGYAVKRTTIARGYRTSMLWLTEFAPIELDAEPTGITNKNNKNDGSTEDAPTLLSSKDLAKNGIDFSPEFLKKDREPVPWRNRWLGEAIEFASFGQTILAIVKAWGVIRLVDLKIKLGIMGMRWQMRTLARATREFVASGILKFVAAMRADETQLFKDCIKFERDPTPSEWAVYLAAGRKRAPMTEMRAKFKREQSRYSGYNGYNGNDNMSEMDMASAIDDEDEDMLDPNGTNDTDFSFSSPAWAIDVPLVNLIFDVVDRAGIDGITSPQICRATLGPSFARYIFSLVSALSRPNNQPDHLAKFQLHCEPTRLGKNKAYLFRTLANAKVAERINNGESIESIEQEAAETAAAEKARVDKIEELRASGKLVGHPADDFARLYGFAPLPPPMTQEELAAQKAKYSASHRRKKTGRPLKYRLIAGEGMPGVDANGSVFEASEAGTPTPKRRGRPPKVREPEEDTEMIDAGDEGNNAGDRSEDVVAATPPPPKRRGRPPKAKPVDVDADNEVETAEPEQTPTPKRGRGRPPKTVIVEPEEEAEAEKDTGPVPTVRLGEPNSLGPKSVERRGRRKRSIVVIFHLDQLRDSSFLEEQKGYKEGAIRVEPDEDEEDEDGEGEDVEMEVDEADEIDEIDKNQEGENAQPASTLADFAALAADLEPIATRYDGKLGHLTVDLDEKTLQFTYAIPRRGRRPAQPREPITISADSLASKPAIRDDGDGQALILEVREANTEDADGDNEEADKAAQEGDPTSPYIFILDQAEGNDKHLAQLLDILVALQARSQSHEPEQGPEQEKEQDEAEADTTTATPVRGRGRLPGQKSKKKGRFGKSVAAAAADNGPTEFVCETCQGTWKNLLGLQYHQTKARTACNPNYTPISAEDKALKKQQEREEREQKRQAAEEAERAEKAELAQNGGRAARAGRALRERKHSAGAFREMSPVSVGSARSLSHSPMRSPSPSSDTPEPTVSPSPKKDASQSQGQIRNSQTPIKIHGNRRRTVRLQEPDSSDDDTPSIRRRGITLPVLRGPKPGDNEANGFDFDSDEEPTVVPAQPQPQVEDTPMVDSGYAVQDQEPEPVVEPVADESQYPSLDMDDVATPPPYNYNGGAQHDPNQSLIDSPHKMGPAGFRMPPLPKNSQKLSPQSLRSYIIMEITKYLVDCFGGIFPGDRSLWHAAFHIYTRTFPGEEPPNMTVIKAAVKKLEIAKEIEEHTFGFRDARGQFIYCRLLARPGTDLFASATAIDFKKRIQASFPQPYVPIDFAPSDRDLAILKTLDKDNSRNSRGRRPLQPEIEVLKAPFYEQPQVTRSTNNAVRLVGYDDDEDDDGADPSRQQRTPNGKRKSMLTAGDLTGVGGGGVGGRGGSSAEPTPKRRKMRNVGPFAENSLYRALGGGNSADAAMEDDPEADIDPALRTVRPTQASRLVNVTSTIRNPGLDSLPASFFLPDDEVLWNRSRTKPAQVRTEGNDGFTTFIHFLPPNTGLASGDDDDEQVGDDVEEDSDYDYVTVGKHVSESASKLPQPRAYKIVTKTHTLYDLRRNKTSPRPWPVVSETTFQRQSDASFTMDGFMPTRKALVRANLPRTPADCATMLRGNIKPADFAETPEGIFNRDVESCLSWEISVPGTDLLRNPSVAPRYVFFHMAFPGAHYTAEDAEAQEEGRPCADKYAHPPLRWNRKNLYSVNTIPYGALDGGITNTNATETALNTLAPTTPAQRKKWTRSATEIAAQREKQAQQAKYGTSSRREMTAYPQKPDDYVQDLTASASAAAGGMDWSANDTLVAAFVVVRTLLGGVSQVIDWGLMMRLFPDKRLSALRNFWKNTRRERQPHIDKFTERFQEAYLAAYETKTIPPIDYDDVLAYDWGWLVGWALKLMRHDANNLPDTRRALEEDYTLVNLPQSRMVNWRDDFFHPARSVWNRLHDTTSEPAAVSIDCKAAPVTPTEAAAAGRLDKLRYMVARSWIRALCGTPHSRYQPSHIKRQLLTLGSLGTMDSGDKEGDDLDETTANNLLQEVIGNLTTDRILRRTKSLISLGGRMYTLTEAYENTLEKLAMEEKFRQAYLFKQRLDETFGQSGKATPSYDIPVNTNDDGMVMALMNLQAHGRVRVEAVDAPHIPFGFEPGNYESRKFPKHYQRFRTRIVPTDRYVYNEDDVLRGALNKVASAVGREDDDIDNEAPCPRKGPYQEMPIWRDFFGVLDRTWFARLAGAVVFLLATRGATPVQQAAAQLRPTIELFEVQMIFEWATKAGILVDRIEDDGSRGVAEWWWLLVGQVHMSAAGSKNAGGVEKEKEKQVEERAGETAKP